ncbi:hypothetical protein DL93DRAFT_929868 [Clavulina sp. PMI_390]|nr:hypothetical protein DL93DRAFT_929868 [Clavulina sp. PMI_390]
MLAGCSTNDGFPQVLQARSSPPIMTRKTMVPARRQSLFTSCLWWVYLSILKRLMRAAGNLTLRMFQDGCPLFYFKEDPHCFRPRLHAIAGSMRPVLTLQLKDFTTHILSPSDPIDGHAKIVELQRWQYKAKLRHQFILLHCVVDVGPAQLVWGVDWSRSPPKLRIEFWLRIERSAQTNKGGIQGFSSVFPPDDRVLIHSDAQHLINAGEPTQEEKLELVSQIQYHTSETRTSVLS